MDSNAAEPRASFDAIFPTREQFLESCMAQEFSLSKPIMEYIWSNPSSPEVYQKLIKSCKLFFLKNPILVLKNLEYNRLTGWEHCNSNQCDLNNHKREHKEFRKDEFEGKIWVTGQLFVSTRQNSKITSNLIPKMYRNNIKVLVLFDQILTHDELKYLATGVEECSLGGNVIRYGNGEEVPVDEVIKLFSGAKSVSLYLGSNSFTAAYTRYAEFFVACCNIGKVGFCVVPPDFDVGGFYQQMKLRKSRFLVSISSWFNGPVFNAVMDEIADEILGTESFDFTPPALKYYGQDEAKIIKMEKIQAREAAKYR